MLRLLVLIVSLLAVLAVPVGTLAQDGVASPAASTPVPSRFEIAPMGGDDPAITARGYFIYELAAGDEATGSVRLSNPGLEQVTVELVAVDSETAQNGGSAFAAAESLPLAVGAWLRLDASQVTIAPGEQTALGFSVRAPEGTAPGQYLAGIAAYIPAASDGTPTAAGANEVGASIIMQTRYVIGVEVDVPGEWTPSLTISGTSAPKQPSGTKLGIAIRNNGDTFLKPEGSVTLSNAAATPILTQSIQLGTVLTGTDITYSVAWPGVPVGGQYGVDVELNYAEDQVARYRGPLTISDDAPAAAPAAGAETQPAVAPVPVPASSFIQPWMIVTTIGLLVPMVVLLAIVLLRGRRRSSW